MTLNARALTSLAALLLFGVLAVGLGVLLPLGVALTIKRETSLAQDRLAMLQSGSAEGSGLAALVVRSASPALAAADLQARVGSVARSHNVSVRSIQVLAPVPADAGLTAVPIELSVSTDLAGLRDFLFEIESGSPLLIVDDLDVRRTSTADAADKQAVVVETALKLRGFSKVDLAP